MSLLLDALNRASKDKASAASTSVTQVPVASAPVPAASDAERSLATEPPPDLHIDWPTLVPSPPPIDLSLTDSPPVPPVAVSRDAQTLDAMMELVAMPQAVPAPPTPPTPPFTPPQTPPAAPAFEPASAPTPMPELPVTPQQRPSATANSPTPVDSTRAAKNLIRAKTTSAKPAFPMRLVALISVAVLLASGLISVMFGLWGDPMACLPASPSLTSVTPPAIPTEVPAAQPAPDVAAVTTEPAAPASSVPTPTPLVINAMAGRTKSQPSRQVAAAPTASPCPPGQSEAECQALKKSVEVAAQRAAPGKSAAPLLESRSTGPSALELGYAALTQGRPAEAAQAYAQALRANPEERDALLGLAYMAHQQGRKEEALGYYKRVLRQEPDNPQAKAGLLLLSPTEDLQALGSQSRENAEQNPNSAAAQSVLGHSLVRQGRLAEAQLAFDRAHTLEPAVALHAFNLAVALDRLRNYASARRYYEEALALSIRSGGERASSVSHIVVRRRIEQLQDADL